MNATLLFCRLCKTRRGGPVYTDAMPSDAMPSVHPAHTYTEREPRGRVANCCGRVSKCACERSGSLRHCIFLILCRGRRVASFQMSIYTVTPTTRGLPQSSTCLHLQPSFAIAPPPRARARTGCIPARPHRPTHRPPVNKSHIRCRAGR